MGKYEFLSLANTLLGTYLWLVASLDPCSYISTSFHTCVFLTPCHWACRWFCIWVLRWCLFDALIGSRCWRGRYFFELPNAFSPLGERHRRKLGSDPSLEKRFRVGWYSVASSHLYKRLCLSICTTFMQAVKLKTFIKKEQGRIHRYPSHVRVGRGHIWDHDSIWEEQYSQKT